MSKYILNVDLLQAGDVICTRENAPLSKGIRSALSCEYSHVMIYVAYSSCIHADREGVHSINLQRMLFDSDSDAIVLRHKSAAGMDSDELERICAYPRSKVGTEYSVRDALKAGFAAKYKFSPKVDASLQYCSRLVAEAFEYANLSISSQPSLCTPADIQNNPAFQKLQSTLRIADAQEIDFAQDKKRNVIAKQTRITNKIMQEAKAISNKKIQTFGDIFEAVIENPAIDEQMESLIHESGYLTLWADDMLKCPHRYFRENYPTRAIIKCLKPDGLHLELNFANEDFERYNTERKKLVKINNKYPRKVFEQQILLHQTLISLSIQRKNLFVWLLEQQSGGNG